MGISQRNPTEMMPVSRWTTKVEEIVADRKALQDDPVEIPALLVDQDYWQDTDEGLTERKRWCNRHRHPFYHECPSCTREEIRDHLRELVKRFTPYSLATGVPSPAVLTAGPKQP